MTRAGPTRESKIQTKGNILQFLWDKVKEDYKRECQLVGSNIDLERTNSLSSLFNFSKYKIYLRPQYKNSVMLRETKEHKLYIKEEFDALSCPFCVCYTQTYQIDDYNSDKAILDLS